MAYRLQLERTAAFSVPGEQGPMTVSTGEVNGMTVVVTRPHEGMGGSLVLSHTDEGLRVDALKLPKQSPVRERTLAVLAATAFDSLRRALIDLGRYQELFSGLLGTAGETLNPEKVPASTLMSLATAALTTEKIDAISVENLA